MARGTDKPGQFSAGGYMASQATNNAYYAGKYGYSYTLGNLYTDAAIKSGVVNPGGYTGLPEETGRLGSQRSNPRASRGQPFDQFGNPTKQKGDKVLTQVQMGGYQFPGQVWTPQRSKGGTYMANELSMWMQKLGAGGRSFNFGQFRVRGVENQSNRWQNKLTQATTGPGVGTSSVYQGFERYSTQETRMGTDIMDPNAGFKKLQPHSRNQHYISELSNMYKEKNTQTGPARRFERKFL